MQKNLFRVSALMIMAVFFLTGCKQAATEPGFDNAWIRAIPPGIKMTAGYGTIRNDTADELVIDSFSSPFFREVSLHRTELVDGVNKMREVENLVIAAGDSLELAPGGYHLMLIAPNKSIVQNQVVPLEMNTADGRTFNFQVPVEKR